MSSPLVRVETAPTMRIVVDLPAPLGPSNAERLARRTSKSMPSTAAKSLYFLVRALARITGPPNHRPAPGQGLTAVRGGA